VCVTLMIRVRNKCTICYEILTGYFSVSYDIFLIAAVIIIIIIIIIITDNSNLQ